jgi:eukaryotic-like serine/threonine-protein kinase
MGTHDLPNDLPHPSTRDSSDRTLSVGAPGGAAAGQIGPCRLLQMLGEGGMGEVWLAEQRTPIHRMVALKLIKAGMDTKAVVARFESEQQALALMDHPSIAKVFDAGSTAEGRPYFVMEYVPGLPITEYCDKHRLPMRERLELFMQVCDGVQHAHQKAIIHRDLKPSNVLVVEQDNKAVPKIIDFGLAKAIAQRLTDKTMFTELGVMMGTPEYMSPEQADQREQNIDTRTDVYSLGVILYQLLVGALPFDVKTLRAAGMEALLRAIREQEPPKPSTRIRSMGEACAASAERRRQEPRTFARHLRGELDWITMKTLEKDRTRRYGSPAELGADIGRHLHNEPVRAHPPSPGYLAGKYIRRHRLGVAAAAAGLLLLVGFAITQAVELRRITRERDRADRITAFMTNMFKVSDPSEARGNTITAREILDKAATEIDTGLSNDPQLQAKMMHTMAVTYDGLGLYSRAQPLLERAVDIQRRTLGPGSPDTLKSMAELASVWAGEGHYTESEKLIREILEIRRRVLGPEHPDTLNSMNDLAVALMGEGRYAEAEKLERETIDTQRRVLGPDNRYTMISMSNLALTLMDEGQYAESEKLNREILEIRLRVLGPEHPDTLNSMTSVAVALMDEGRYTEAEKLERTTLDIQRRVLGMEHPQTLREMSYLALTVMDEGRYAEAEKLERTTLDIQRRVLGPEHPDTLNSMNLLADTLMDEGQYVESEKLNREILEIRRRVLGPKHANTVRSMNNLAVDLSHEKRYGEAEKLFREAIHTADQTNHPDVLNDLWYNFACAAAIAGRRDEALEYLGRAVDLGFSNADAMAADNDLKSLHADQRFEALVANARQRAAAVQKSN